MQRIPIRGIWQRIGGRPTNHHCGSCSGFSSKMCQQCSIGGCSGRQLPKIGSKIVLFAGISSWLTLLVLTRMFVSGLWHIESGWKLLSCLIFDLSQQKKCLSCLITCFCRVILLTDGQLHVIRTLRAEIASFSQYGTRNRDSNINRLLRSTFPGWRTNQRELVSRKPFPPATVRFVEPMWRTQNPRPAYWWHLLVCSSQFYIILHFRNRSSSICRRQFLPYRYLLRICKLQGSDTKTTT